MISSMEKAKEKYDRKCQEAIEITTAMRKSDNSTLADVNSSSSDSSDEVSASKELTDKLAAGAGQLLTKMWDTTSSFGRNPLERQRSKLYSSLEDVIAAEKHYVHTVDYTNAQRLIFEREIKENLHAFQLTEEQRLEYLRDVLMRMQKAFISMFSRSQQFVERMKASANKVDELVSCVVLMVVVAMQEFRSLLAEPVSLSLATMKSEYESVRVTTQESFSKLHSSLCNEAGAHKKLHQKLDTKARDFAMTFSYLPGATPVATNSYGIDVTQALMVLSANARLFNEKERRSEAKLRQLAEEIRQLQAQATESTKVLKQTYQNYVQEIEVFISTCMKNEKYRLQVGKNSLQSLAKAVEHMLQGGASVGNKALIEFEKIDPSTDMAEFIRINRQPLSDEDESEDSGTEQEEEFTESQPLGVSDFQKKFKLDSPEQVVESFSCALYLSNFPYHGRLYLTRDRMCFSGWMDTIFIESTTVTEAKDAVKAWLNAALDATKEQTSTGSSSKSPAPANKPSEQPSESVSTRDAPPKEPTKEVDSSTSSSSTAPNKAASTSSNGLPAQLHPTIQAAIIICALMFVYTMYRVCAAMNQMQALTRESLVQQRQQHELLKELLEKLGSTRER
ncbi:hypothetical protein AM588_10010678 [Phytophthora nicotianae]|uniref:F-BAR domain-containing protein n=1 Tax=Phytophthora nicotianae TaxID=4792 RepID=A0A0W8DGS6_PHYNI|nr:hypothetical protein AM588_10010678 [Phytophthora nicotianae]